MSCAGLLIVYVQRVSLSLAIVCMVNHTALYAPQVSRSGDKPLAENATITTTLGWTTDLTTLPSNTSLDHSSAQNDQRCGNADDLTGEVPNSDEDGPFEWDKRTQGLILAALYIGYSIGQIPTSIAIHHFGIRKTLSGCFLVMSLCHALCHPAALLSPWAVFTLRIISGIGQGNAIISAFALWRNWAPVHEQSRLMGISFCGEMLGSIAAFYLTSLLCRYGFLDGWPSVFYIFGGVGVVWSIGWFLLMRDSPEQHPCISPAERRYIVMTRAADTEVDKVSVPWRSILRCPCFWAYAAALLSFAWGLFLMLSNLPTFLYEVMHFDIESNGVYSMLPYIATFVAVSAAGFIFDLILERRIMSKLVLRKVVTFLSATVPGILLVVMSHMQCHQATLVVTMLTIAVGLSGLAIPGGFVVYAYDFAPRYAFQIFTVVNTVTTITGVIGPYLVAVITADRTQEQWQIVFYITGAVYLLSTIIFCVLARAGVQPWAVPGKETEVPPPPTEDSEIHLN
ncbi:putative transporter slc-17.2 [Babylonia areolata]|uniref:putative transporter slc-17.2 n=1 Tax=Babylonia areolata TaxID=304850 RepID=UPI003FCF06E2